MPWPMRFGPPPRIMIFLRSVGSPRTRPRRSNTGTVEVELGRAGVDALEHRAHAQRCRRAHRGLVGVEPTWPGGGRRSPSLEPRSDHRLQQPLPAPGERRSGVHDVLDLGEEPGSILVRLKTCSTGQPAEGLGHVPDALRAPGWRSRARIDPRGRRPRPRRGHHEPTETSPRSAFWKDS